MTPESSEGLDVSGLSPADAVVALRSYPRRFRVALTSVDPDEEIPAAAVGHAAELARVVALVRNALGQVLTAESPVLPAAVVDESRREWTMPADEDVDRVLDVLVSETEGLAAEVASVASGDWGRTGRVTGGGTVGALDLVREAVRSGHRHLRAAEDEVRRTRGR